MYGSHSKRNLKRRIASATKYRRSNNDVSTTDNENLPEISSNVDEEILSFDNIMNLLENDGDDDILSFADLDTFENEDQEIESDGNRDSPSFKLDLENLSPLYNGANISLEEFVARFFKIKKQGSLSDSLAQMMLVLIKNSLPASNRLPSTIEAMRQCLQSTVPELGLLFKTSVIQKFEDESVLCFDFMSHLKLIVKENFNFFEIKDNSQTNAVVEIKLMLHIDGAQMSKSSAVKLWPVSAVCMNLPKRIRYNIKNVLILTMSVSRGAIDFNKLIQPIKDRYDSLPQILMYGENLSREFKYKVSFLGLTGDIPAIRESNGFKSYNSLYGCTFCNQKALSIGNRRVWKQSEENDWKTSSYYLSKVKEVLEKKAGIIESNNDDSDFGISHLSPWIPLLVVPDQLSVDWFHTILLGPLKEDINLIINRFSLVDKRTSSNRTVVNGLSRSELEKISSIFKKTNFPVEIKRSLKGLDELNYFKGLDYKLIFLYMLPTVLIFETTGSVRDLMVIDSILFAGVASLMHDNITADLIHESQFLINFWFKRRFEKLGHSSSTIKSHLITHLPKLSEKYSNICNTSCFHGEGLLYLLGKMISLNDFKNILPQIQKRLIDYIAAERILSTIYDRKKSKERLPSSDIMALCTELSIPIEFYRSLGGFYLNSFYLKCSERFILHRDSLLIYKSEEGVYHAGYLLAYFESLSNTNDHKLIVAPLCVHNNHILSMISPGCNVIDIQTLKKSSVLKQYKVVSNKLFFGELPKKEYPYIVISISKVVSKALYIETEKFHFICPLLNSFEHN